jgi:hypothetical protein
MGMFFVYFVHFIFLAMANFEKFNKFKVNKDYLSLVQKKLNYFGIVCLICINAI